MGRGKEDRGDAEVGGVARMGLASVAVAVRAATVVVIGLLVIDLRHGALAVVMGW